MNDTNKGATVETPKNYSTEQEQYLTDNAPISYEACVKLAAEWGKKPRSIISKVKQLGLDYIPKAKPTKKVSKGDTKAQLVEKIETALNAKDHFAGLEKANSASLVNLLGFINLFQSEQKAND